MRTLRVVLHRRVEDRLCHVTSQSVRYTAYGSSSERCRVRSQHRTRCSNTPACAPARYVNSSLAAAARRPSRRPVESQSTEGLIGVTFFNFPGFVFRRHVGRRRGSSGEGRRRSGVCAKYNSTASKSALFRAPRVGLWLAARREAHRHERVEYRQAIHASTPK